MPRLQILHLSDIHIGNTIYEDVSELAISITEAIENHDKKIDCVVVTGDIFDGTSTMSHDLLVGKAVEFFEELKDGLNDKCSKSLTKNDFVFVPGNHDQIRTENGDVFDKYRNFLNEFHAVKSGGSFPYDDEHLFTIKVYDEAKVALVGLNSCMIEQEGVSANELKLIQRISEDFQLNEAEVKKTFTDVCQQKWDDYGKISNSQLRKAFRKLENETNDLNDYTIVTCFHHHFYPFPEIYNKFGDSSIIRNFTTVIDKLQSKNVKVVLHGHKHLPIIRPVTNQKYLTDPDSVLYVLSAGSIGQKTVTNRSFQIVDIFSPNNNRIADVSRFTYSQEQLNSPENFHIPPKKNYDQTSFVRLLDIYKEEFPDEYEEYLSNIFEFDNVSLRYRIEDILANISKCITKFDSIKAILVKDHKKLLILLLSVHYRILFLDKRRKKSKAQNVPVMDVVKQNIEKVCNDDVYCNMLVALLKADLNVDIERKYEKIEENATRDQKLSSAFTIVGMYFTDLYLTLSEYGEFYYTNEKLRHRVNIKLEENTFHNSIPLTTIEMDSDVDRRTTSIMFKCKNPTVHKIAVLIIKDFEKRLNKIEDSFKLLGLKIYYLNPKVTKDQYNLDNFNFEAYIPTLLPLLTGDNLYNQKEVFIRELIQNSLDAILLREKVDKSGVDFDKRVKIVFGKEKHPKTGKFRKYLRIIDEGIGMDQFRVERYFTSIGRSFYVSDEFEDMQKANKIKYQPVSNFGIGFLSAFMVCQEIRVRTKSYESEKKGLDIHIPNYDGCFFINEIEGDIKTGTTITIYEDERIDENGSPIFNVLGIKEYIKETFLDFQLDIEILDKLSSQELTLIPNNSLKKSIQLPLFVPYEPDHFKDISWNEIKKGDLGKKYRYGLLIDFFDERVLECEGNTDDMNAGIMLFNSCSEIIQSYRCFTYSNYPSALIELDVARELILKFKGYLDQDKLVNTRNRIIEILIKQSEELIDYSIEACLGKELVFFDNMVRFFIKNDVIKEKIGNLRKKLFVMDFSVDGSKAFIRQPKVSEQSFSHVVISERMMKFYLKTVINFLKQEELHTLFQDNIPFYKELLGKLDKEHVKGVSIEDFRSFMNKLNAIDFSRVEIDFLTGNRKLRQIFRFFSDLEERMIMELPDLSVLKKSGSEVIEELYNRICMEPERWSISVYDNLSKRLSVNLLRLIKGIPLADIIIAGVMQVFELFLRTSDKHYLSKLYFRMDCIYMLCSCKIGIGDIGNCKVIFDSDSI